MGSGNLSNYNGGVPGKSTANSDIPSYDKLKTGLAECSRLVDEIVLKNYLTKLDSMEMVPLDSSLKKISNIRLFKINEMVYQKDEYSTYKLASVFNAVQNLNCSVFVIADGSKNKTDFYMGVRSLDGQRTTKSLKDTLKNALIGQFPGVKTTDLFDDETEGFLNGIESKNITSVSCVAQNKDREIKNDKTYIQGLEKLAIAMRGRRYTAVILAKSTSSEQLKEVRRSYESIYTQLSPFANMQLSYGTNEAMTVSEAFSQGGSSGVSYSETVGTNESQQTGTSIAKGTSNSETKSRASKGAVVKTLAGALANVAGVITAPLTGGTSVIAAGVLSAGLNAVPNSSLSKGTSTNYSQTESMSKSYGSTASSSYTASENRSQTRSDTKGLTSGTSNNMQLTMQNKTLMNTLERIDLQLKRLEECESIGMWECAAYFLSDSQETAEMAAGTYKALMRGEKSGVETSAINFWGRQQVDKLPILRDYITNFIHPEFEYRSDSISVPVTAATLVSGNELAIQMGLPRRSVCGFPVIEHAEFGKEVVRYNKNSDEHTFVLGKVVDMEFVTDTDVTLDRDSLTMHTFVTGSTGSGKSNTVYELLNQLRIIYRIPFMVIEPAKGEYKNVFGQFPNVSVYGTNPNKTELLRINPFRFPPDIHILEHLDRLVEIFNVCWPMYAAMPAILKESMEKAYISVGWEMETSYNPKGNVFPNFSDLLEQIENVINGLKYSSDSKGDYSGALMTRVRSLTNGLNSLIFCGDDISDADLFDKSVIIDLSRVGSLETKSLIMGLLVMKLNEYRMTSGKSNSSLTHITVLEEAHNLLKRTSTEQSSESSNLLGKTVEMLTNSIAEMRTYGEGFIIADQSPGLLDMSVIRNTNTKIILRLPEQSDRELVGLSANLNKEQIEELAKLERGVAAIYQNDWVEPSLVKVNKCSIQEKPYDPGVIHLKNNKQYILKQIVMFLIQGRLDEHLDFNIDEIRYGYTSLGLSTSICDFIEEQIDEYDSKKKLELWDVSNFRKMSRYVTEILDARSSVENSVLVSGSYDELSERLSAIAEQQLPNSSNKVILNVCQCFMKDMSTRADENDTRKRIYCDWVEHTSKGGIM